MLHGNIPLAVIASPRFPAREVPRLAAASRQAIRRVVDAASPMVFRPDATKANGRLLTPDDLMEVFRDATVTVSLSHGGAFRSREASDLSRRRMPFADFAAYVERSSFENIDRMYLSQFPVDGIAGIPGTDMITSRYIPEGAASVSKNLWFGPAGTVSPLHFDRGHNFLYQHWGRKHIVIVDPSYLHQLKPGPKNSESPHVSSLDLVTPDFAVDVSRLDAPCLEAVLEPGDILFLPALWWHNVLSIDAAISVNYWWRPPISACLYPSFFRMLSSRSVYRDPSLVTHWVDVTPHRLDTALCLYLAHKGHSFGAAAIAGALVVAFCDKVLRMLGIPESRGPASEDGTEALPNSATAETVVSALATQGLINSPQSALLLKWLEMAKETAAQPEPCTYDDERATAIREMIWTLHVELGTVLSR